LGPYVGHVDSYKNGVVWGWVCDPAATDTSLTVRVTFDGVEIGSITANEFRPDLMELGIGNGKGCYSFHFKLPESLRYLIQYDLRFLVGAGAELAGSPLRIVERTGAEYRLNLRGEMEPIAARMEMLSLAHPDGDCLPLNSGIVALNRNAGRPGPRTMIVTGHARSGTSMVAKTLHRAGIPMRVNEPIMSPHYEDTEFIGLLQAAIDQPPLQTKKLKRLIEARNAGHDDWGFKAPAALESMPYLLHHTRNPHVVVVFRDALATSLREHLAVDVDLLESFDSVLEYHSRILKFLRNTDVPCLLVSYEKALLNPHSFCRHLAQFAGLKGDPIWMEDAVRQIDPNQREYLEEVKLARDRLSLPARPALQARSRRAGADSAYDAG
jgi:hypothetical protein